MIYFYVENVSDNTPKLSDLPEPDDKQPIDFYLTLSLHITYLYFIINILNTI